MRLRLDIEEVERHDDGSRLLRGEFELDPGGVCEKRESEHLTFETEVSNVLGLVAKVGHGHLEH